MRNPTIRKLRIQGGIWVLAEESVSPGSWELGLGLKGAGGVVVVVVVVVKGLIRQTKEFLDPSPLFKLRKCTFHGYRVVVRGWWGWTKWVKRVRKDKLPPIK